MKVWQILNAIYLMFFCTVHCCTQYYQCSNQKPNQPLSLHWRVHSNGTMPPKQLQTNAKQNRQMPSNVICCMVDANPDKCTALHYTNSTTLNFKKPACPSIHYIALQCVNLACTALPYTDLTCTTIHFITVN